MVEPGAHNLPLDEVQPLSGRTAVITGTSRGIGAAIARSLAEAGVNIIGSHLDPAKERRQDGIAAEVRKHGVIFQSVLADISEPEGRLKLLQAATGDDPERPGSIDYLILNAAGGLEQGKPPGWADKINNQSQLALVELFLPHLKPGGKIIYLTSLWSQKYGEVEQLPAYEPVARAKHEAEQALRAKIPDLEKRGIKLGIVSGNIIRGTAAYTLFRRVGKEYIDQLEQQAPGGRFPEVEDMGRAVRDMLIFDFETGATKDVGGTQAPSSLPKDSSIW